jgi:hypothetical protein
VRAHKVAVRFPCSSALVPDDRAGADLRDRRVVDLHDEDPIEDQEDLRARLAWRTRVLPSGTVRIPAWRRV